MKKQPLLIALVVYILSAGLVYGGLTVTQQGGSIITTKSTKTANEQAEEETMLGGLLDIDPSEPKDQPCPLNGQLYTQTERDAWEERRPLAVMIENSPDARPQSGLGSADIVFEAVAEGGVTRFMAMMYCGAQAYDIELAPVRSARIYFMELAASFNEPMYVHVGGANVDGPTDALQKIKDWGWELENDINQFSVGYPTFVRDYNRIPGKEIATEHTMVSTTEALWEVSADREWTNMSPERTFGRLDIESSDWNEGYTGWTFVEPTEAAGSVTDISYDFWTGYDQYAVSWTFNPETKAYKRTMAGEAHIDMNTEEQIEASNVIVYLTRERGPLNEKKHMLYDIIGTGEALVFTNGEVKEVDWIKKTRDAEIQLLDGNEPVELAPGLTWVSVISDSNEVTY